MAEYVEKITTPFPISTNIKVQRGDNFLTMFLFCEYVALFMRFSNL